MSMTPEERDDHRDQVQRNNWQDYRELFLADRAENRRRFDHIDGELDKVHEVLAEMRGRNGVLRFLTTIGIPAVVALAVAWLSHR